MALAESIEYDKIEICGKYKEVQVRKATIITKDGTEISRSYHRHVLDIGLLNSNDELVETDISAEPTEVQAICNTVWTTDLKAAYKAKLIAEKTE